MNSKYLDKILLLLYIIFFVSILCTWRAVTSIVIPVILFTGIVKNKVDHHRFFNHHLKNIFLVACCAHYTLQLIFLLTSPHSTASLILSKSAIVFVPLMVCSNNFPDTHVYRKLMNYYVWIMAAGLMYCIITALYKYAFLHASSAVFYYHPLVSPLKQHAIQVSIMLFIAFIYLLESVKRGMFFINKLLHFLFMLLFTIGVILLSSKLVIIFTGFCLLYYNFLFFRSKMTLRFMGIATVFASLAMIILVLMTQNKVSKRFNEVIETNMDLIYQRNFDPGIYFNGVQFRLLQWRFVKEILDEKHAWLTGVGDDAQNLLDEKYITTHMYTGDGKSTDRGYLRYDTHNQFLESLLQSGMLGLIVFAFMWGAMIVLVIKGKSRVLSFVVALLLAYSLNESLLERQYSMIIFTFFPLFFYYRAKTRVRTEGS